MTVKTEPSEEADTQHLRSDLMDSSSARISATSGGHRSTSELIMLDSSMQSIHFTISDHLDDRLIRFNVIEVGHLPSWPANESATTISMMNNPIMLKDSNHTDSTEDTMIEFSTPKALHIAKVELINPSPANTTTIMLDEETRYGSNNIVLTKTQVVRNQNITDWKIELKRKNK